MKKSLLTLALVGVLTIGGTGLAFADANEVATKGSRQNGTSGVQRLVDSGLSFEEAKAKMLEIKYERVDAAVDRGTITAEEAETIKAEMKANFDACTTPGENRGKHEGYGLKQGLGGKGNRNGMRQGKGRCGDGAGLKDGSCLVTE